MNSNIKMPLVSVIMPAYNCADTIAESIESVRVQTYNSWELIIVNDCSIDDTQSIVEEYLSSDPRIHLINHEKNGGSAKARNTAISNASGRFIAFLDSDDLWKPNKLTRQIDYMLRNNFCFTFTSYEILKDKNTKRKVFNVPYSVNYHQYLKNTIIGNLTVVIDKSQIEDFHVVSGDLEDVLTWMYYLRLGISAYGINENLASYRVRATSKSGDKIKNARRYFECLKRQEGISSLYRVFCEVNYIFNAIKKRVF